MKLAERPPMPRDTALDRLLASIDAAASRPDAPAPDAPLERCLARLDAQPATPPEPLRTLHHFACTGGTLISKCIAALPNVQLLSEVDPLSDYVPAGAEDFSPTDLVLLLRRSTRGTSPAQLAALFAEQMRWLQRDAVRHGLRLVLRDHAHSQFCAGGAPAERPTLREMLPAGMPLRSLVTVRHPLDSFAALQRHGWVQFAPATIDAYCRRYAAFLDRHAGLPLLRYEDFVAAPERRMQAVCEALALRYEAHFVRWFAGFKVSGDSGRSGTTIAARASTAEAVALEAEAARSEAYRALVARLGYGLRAGSLEPAA